MTLEALFGFFLRTTAQKFTGTGGFKSDRESALDLEFCTLCKPNRPTEDTPGTEGAGRISANRGGPRRDNTGHGGLRNFPRVRE